MPIYYADESVTLWHGDCLDVIAALPDASVDAVVTDPPYGLEFMGRDWDSFRPPSARIRTRVDGRTNPTEGKSTTSMPEAYVAGPVFQQWCQAWATECLRVLKPGGHMLAFGGTRTVHRLTCAIEDAGFEIRDGIDWIYGSGFPKSLDVSKAIDKARDDRADINRVTRWLAAQRDHAGMTNREVDAAFGFSGMAGHWTAAPHLKIAQVPRWEQWEKLRHLIGFGDEMDAEVWRLNGRKGQPGEAWSQREVIGERTSGIGAGRGAVAYIGDSENRDVTAPATDDARRWAGWGTALKPAREPIVVARKPLAGTVAANVLTHGTGALNIDACRTAAGQDYRDKCASVVGLDSNRNGDTYGEWTGTREDSAHPDGRWPTNVAFGHDCPGRCLQGCPVGELGELARFFPVFRYEAKAPADQRPRVNGTAHPTVKPLDLMRWLVRLVTPPGGTVLEPFAGSGTTAEACVIEGFRCLAIERDADYLPLITARLTKPLQPTLFGQAAA